MGRVNKAKVYSNYLKEIREKKINSVLSKINWTSALVGLAILYIISFVILWLQDFDINTSYFVNSF